MPITIQEIIASDTISQLVDKTNFNFDQLLLNGGGPAGPAGIQGPTGPVGGRGPKGSTWYEDSSTTSPGVSPITTPPTATPLSGDYYLQFNGYVWEYNGTTWVVTTVDLTGPTGPAGPAGGFGNVFGSPTLLLENTLYNNPIGEGNGATAANEGIPSIMVGGAVSNTPSLGTIPLTDAYIIPDGIATDITSDVASLFIHQKDSSGRAIVFQGGNATGNVDKFDQTSLVNLSNIALGSDDKLIINVPKAPTNPLANISELVGFEVYTPYRSHLYTAGQQMSFITGDDATLYSTANENSDFKISVGLGSDPGGNKFEVVTLGTAGSTVMQAGKGILLY